MNRGNKVKFFSLAFVVVTFVSCYTKRETSLLLENGLPVYQQSTYEPHRIAVNDELQLRVISLNGEISSMFGSNSTSTQTLQIYRVFPDSTIDVPYANKVKVVGLTIREAQNKLKEVLADFDKNLEVRMAFVNKSFTFVGESGRGIFPIDKERFTIYDALAVSGGLKQTSDYKNVHKIIDFILKMREENPELFEKDGKCDTTKAKEAITNWFSEVQEVAVETKTINEVQEASEKQKTVK